MRNRQQLFTFYTVQQMHTRSFTNPQFLKIGLTHKNSPQWSRQLSQHALLRASEGKAHGCAFQRRKDARSRHQRLFVENVRKTEGNRSKRKFQVRELYLRLRKVLTPLTFVPKDNNLFFRIVEIVLP